MIQNDGLVHLRARVRIALTKTMRCSTDRAKAFHRKGRQLCRLSRKRAGLVL